MATPDFALQVLNLKKDYRLARGKFFPAVKGISFEVHPGECVGLLGPNGAGKSTAIHCISGFYPPTSGHVFILGHDVHRDPKSARQVLGTCPQEDSLDSDFNVLDQMVRHATFFRIPVREGKKRAEELLKRFNLSDKSSEMVESLSGGMKRRLQVARALMSNPKLLLLDEPTTGLDPEVRRILWDVLGKCRDQGIGILLSTHYMEEAERLCDRVLILHQGEMLGIHSPKTWIETHMGTALVEDQIRPGVVWKRPPNLEDVYLKLTGTKLDAGNSNHAGL